MNKIFMALAVLLLLAHAAFSEVLVLHNGDYIAGVSVLRNVQGMIVYEKDGQIYEISADMISSLAKVAPKNGRSLTQRELGKAAQVTRPREAGQVASEPVPQHKLECKYSFWGYGFYHGDEKVSSQEVQNLLMDNEEAISLYNSGQQTNAGAGVLQFAGGFAIGWPLGQALAGNPEPSWILAVLGVAVAIPGIILEANAGDKFKQAFEIYNQQGKQPKDSTSEGSWQFSASGDRIAIVFGY